MSSIPLTKVDKTIRRRLHEQGATKKDTDALSTKYANKVAAPGEYLKDYMDVSDKHCYLFIIGRPFYFIGLNVDFLEEINK